jgi:hypothetical protein
MAKQSLRGLLGTFLLVLVLGGTGWAQVTTGSISGTVQDASGAVLPGVAIAIRDADTGLKRDVVTDEAGRFSAQQLPLGNYEVEASLTGFQTEVRRGIVLTIGREAVVNISLSVGSVSSRVEVTAEAPLVETTNASVAYLVDDKKIRDLPLNGRNYTQLAVLQPGVLGFNLDRQDSTSGKGTQMSISGGSNVQNSFLLDGQDVNDTAGRTPGSAASTNLGIDAIREFTVVANNYSSQYGLVTGAVMNVVTRTGTNKLDASVFEFLRNSALDAKNYFDPKYPAPIPPFKRNQFGGTIGGPVVKDKTFFLFAYEGLRQRLGLTLVGTVPDAPARAGCLPYTATNAPPPYPTTTDPQCAAFPGIDKFIGVDPGIAARLNAFPLPNASLNTDGTGTVISGPVMPSTENYYLARIDHKLTEKDTIFFRYTMDRAVSDGDLEKIPIVREHDMNHYQYGTLDWTRVFGASAVNEFRFAANRSWLNHDGLNLTGIPDAQLADLQGQPYPATFTITSPFMGTTSGGGGYNETLRVYALTLYEYGDNYHYTHGAHSLSLGAIYKRYNFALHNVGKPGLTFTSLQKFLQAAPVALSTFQGDLDNSVQQQLFGWYVQDDIRISRNFTINLGLRQEFTGAQTEKYGKGANLTNISDAQVTVGPLQITPKDNFAPRVGLAWDVFGNGKTAVRAGAGVYYEQLVPSSLRNNTGPNYPFKVSIVINNPKAPNNLVADPNNLPAGSRSEFGREDHPKLPATYKWSMDIQQQLAPNTTFSLAYVGSRSNHIQTVINANPFVPEICPCPVDPGNPNANPPIPPSSTPTLLPVGTKYYPIVGKRVNTNWSTFSEIRWEGQAYYHALQASIVRRFSQGLQFQGSYTWSKNIDTSSNGWSGSITKNGATAFQDPYNIGHDRGLSNNDVRHLLTMNTTYDIPFGNRLSGIGKAALGGWQVNGLLSFQTGLPFGVSDGFNRSNDGQTGGPGDRPDLVAGANPNTKSGLSSCLKDSSGNPVPVGTTAHYFDPCVFALQTPGTYGNLPRNVLIGPSLFNLDTALNKSFTITEHTNLAFRAEFFNILNHPNFGLINTTTFTGTGARNASAGQIISTLNTSRQIQLGLKLSF